MKYWKTARLAGASIIDMTGALEAEPAVVVRGPWAVLSPATSENKQTSPKTREPDLTTLAVVAAHPAALMLLLIVNRLHARRPLRTVSATVFEPASQHGRAAMDELHQQTVGLLSFQTLPREQFDAQVAFNLLPSLGDAAKVNLAAAKQRIASHYAALSARRTACAGAQSDSGAGLPWLRGFAVGRVATPSHNSPDGRGRVWRAGGSGRCPL